MTISTIFGVVLDFLYVPSYDIIIVIFIVNIVQNILLFTFLPGMIFISLIGAKFHALFLQ